MPSVTPTDAVDIEIRLNERFEDIYSLCYALIDLQAVANSTAYITTHKELSGKKIPSTVRSFGKKYKDALKLKTFSQGSFVATVAAGVVTGVILKFLDRYFERAETQQVHHHLHIHNGASPIQVRFEDREFETRINEVLDGVEIIPDDIESSLGNTIHAVNASGLLGESQIAYAPNGLAILAQDIERLGTNINITV
jgi:hypothetical protein